MWLLYTDRPGYASRLLLANIDHVSEFWALQLTENSSVYSAQGRLQKVPCRRRIFRLWAGESLRGTAEWARDGREHGRDFRSNSAVQGNSSALGLILGRAITCLVTCLNTNRVPQLRAKFILHLNTMFKGILPPRRVPTPEFTIVSPLVDNGKENLPASPALHPEASQNGKVAAVSKSGKAAATTQDKPKRKKGGDVPPHTAPITVSTDREFDRLLVRAVVEVPQSSALLLSCFYFLGFIG